MTHKKALKKRIAEKWEKTEGGAEKWFCMSFPR